MRSPTEHSSSGSFLSAVYSDRQGKNSSYSLRAFARAIGVAPSYLLSLMSGKRNLSIERAQSVSERLKLAPEARDYFVNLVELERAKSTPIKEPLRRRLGALKMKQSRRVVGKNSFSILSRWYYPAIVAALDTTGSPTKSECIAEKLGLDKELVHRALSLLEMKGWVKEDKNGNWVRSINHVLLKSETTDLHLRAFHAEMLRLTKNAITNREPSSRITRTETLAINVEQLPKLKVMVEDFIEQLIALAQEGEERTEVFHLGLHFFRLAAETEEKKCGNA